MCKQLLRRHMVDGVGRYHEDDEREQCSADLEVHGDLLRVPEQGSFVLGWIQN
jgi:hypothetical protein